MDEIPEQFIERQLNDSRYISKVVKTLLSNVVREKAEQEAVSKNVIVCTGGVTDRLKKDWGINDVWNKIVLPRFLRLNELTNSTNFTAKMLLVMRFLRCRLNYKKDLIKKNRSSTSCDGCYCDCMC